MTADARTVRWIAAAVAAVLLAAVSLSVASDRDSAPAVHPVAGASYVAPHGSDAAAGTRAQPWRTLRHALRELRPGSTLYLRAGDYPGWNDAARDGTAKLPITIAAYPGEHPRLTGRLKVSGSWTIVANLHFVGGTPGNRDGVLLYVSGADHVSILDNELDHARMSAIYVGDVGDGSDYLTIAGNRIHDNGSHGNLDHGIYFGTGAHGTIVDNVIEHNLARGVQCYPGCVETLIEHNTVEKNGAAGIQVGSDDVSTSHDDTIVANLVVGNGDDGIRSYWGGRVGTGIVARDNLVWRNRGRNVAGPGIAFVRTVVASPDSVPRASSRFGAR